MCKEKDLINDYLIENDSAYCSLRQSHRHLQ